MRYQRFHEPVVHSAPDTPFCFRFRFKTYVFCEHQISNSWFVPAGVFEHGAAHPSRTIAQFLIFEPIFRFASPVIKEHILGAWSKGFRFWVETEVKSSAAVFKVHSMVPSRDVSVTLVPHWFGLI